MDHRRDELYGAIDQRYGPLAEQNCCLSCGVTLEWATPKHGEVCADLGSGRGHDVLRLAAIVGDVGLVHGVDQNPQMIARARREADKLDLTNVQFHQAQLDDTGIADASVDLVVSNCTLNHAPDKDAVWREVFRILKPGGRFVISDIYASAPVPEQYRDDPSAIAECWGGALTRDEYLAGVSAAGFTSIGVLSESDPYDKGAIQVASITIGGKRPAPRCC